MKCLVYRKSQLTRRSCRRR